MDDIAFYDILFKLLYVCKSSNSSHRDSNQEKQFHDIVEKKAIITNKILITIIIIIMLIEQLR